MVSGSTISGPVIPRPVISGTISRFQQRFEQVQTATGFRSVVVWSFAVERHKPDGTPLPRVAVEMRGLRFSGALANGDAVEVEGSAVEAKVLCVSRVRNLSTRSEVVASGLKGARVGSVVMIFVMVALVAGFSVLFFGAAEEIFR